ncbi:hypothetical protein CCH79_00007458 [Gambusia affinis]|uniref:eIF3h C-terminal domain-containing protein n=1 Tax=Gambusia affinis TaxID=33528 RepID=A0A315WZT9_GAMAF|nr:hypothetical protein CCH79_00007458 [Gambusia affinis]
MLGHTERRGKEKIKMFLCLSDEPVQYLQRRQQENVQRQSRGEPPLPEEDISKLFKPPQAPPRMDTLLIAGQINNYCQNVKEFTSQNLGKLFMAEALQGHN